jgi:hypothetical protein
MTSQRANAIYDIDADRVSRMIDQALSTRPKLKRVSARSFKSVLAYIGHRDRPRNKDKTEHYCDDSLEQIANAIGDLSIDVAADVVALATHLGILKTVRAGGRNTPTRRTIDLDKLNDLVTVATVGIDLDSYGEHQQNQHDSYGEYANSNGEIANSNGVSANSNGVSTVTPIEPREYPKGNHQRTAPDGAAVRGDVTISGDKCDACAEPRCVECVNGWIGTPNNGTRAMRCPQLLKVTKQTKG